MDFGEEASEREKGENYIVFWMILPLIPITPGHCSSRCGTFSNFVRLPDIRMGDGNIELYQRGGETCICLESVLEVEPMELRNEGSRRKGKIMNDYHFGSLIS